jgi:hypothetical protein
MRIFDENIKFKQSSVCLNGVKYSLSKSNVPTGDVVVFTVDKPNSTRDEVFFTLDEAKAFFSLITTNAKK